MLTEDFLRDSDAIHKHAMRSLFERLDSLCEGALAVDRQGRIVWINDKYLNTLGLNSLQEALGRDVEDFIPNSLMREVVQTGQPILLDILEFGKQSFVVTRMPLQNERQEIIGAIGFVLYDRLHYLKPLVAKFASLQNELNSVKKGVTESRRAKYNLVNFVGSAPACLEVKRQARRAAQQDASILLLGETGTGKEILANAIHAMSARANGPFIGVNMAAIPEALLESEFFGATHGAYTGADKKPRDGKFRLADGGTLFLDEIGDMPLPLQGKLLRVLQEREIEPLGSNKVIKVDVRVIAATSIDLDMQVKQGKFRADLYYRLNVLPICLPPLRERLSDMEALCDALLQQIFERTGLPRREISPSAVALLCGYHWPGNVRELRNVLERVAILTDNFQLTGDDFATALPLAAADFHPPADAVEVKPYAEALAAFDRSTISAALSATGGKVPAAAKLLGLSRATLYKKMAALQI
ncbi:MAG: sigma 54-interacting transcriptional regulator [Burkholderiales bacterium]|nr:sigma 54-interacting transcriptional regulator [Burkholderiales bacterium]